MTDTKLDMVKNNDDELETTTADETDINDSLSNCSSDVELDFDKTNKILKAKLNDKVIDIRFNNNCKSKQEALNNLLVKYLSDIDNRRTRSIEYYNKVRDDEEFKHKNKEYKAKWFQVNKEKLRQEAFEKYKNDPEYRNRQIDKAKRAYAKRTADIPKMKRGRKPKQIIVDETPKERRPRGRPKIENKV